MPSLIDAKLKKDEGRRRASLHFAEDFVMTLQDQGDGIYYSNAKLLQKLAKKNLGHHLNDAQITGLTVFFKACRLCKDNQYIFNLASLVCDILDDALDLGSSK